ncbi:hypothetical protein AVEN_94984-1 [Araneus ventricosus]|uniref:Uncharacterized protein n=1 Tax=Araneus ventricosus TaxID=182803 RepID=A0A4Y2NIN2_ARAVE|nr:hypothetical protein AVEN_94984-1 [Araneus ventricosus]
MKGNMLPTYKDVMKFYEWNRHKVKCDNETNKEPTYKEIEDTVMEKNEEIKSRASIPIVQHEQVKAMLKTYNLKRKNLLKFCPKILKKRLVEFRQSVKHCLTLHLANVRSSMSALASDITITHQRKKSFIIGQCTTRKMVLYISEYKPTALTLALEIWPKFKTHI